MTKQLLLSFFVVTLMVGACAKKQVVRPTEPVPAPVQPPVAEAPREEPSVRYQDWQAVTSIKPIYFDYDRADLRDQDRDILKANAEFLKNNPDYMVLVEGHCDERGTTEYNLALGQRRAQAVRDYYGQLGIPLNRVGTISYGKEVPVDPAHTEAAWAKNRRAETKIRSK